MLDKILNLLKDILSPKKCYSCNKEGYFLCEECFSKLDNFEPFCYICKKRSEKFSIHKKCLIENKLLSGANFNDKKVYIDKIIVMTHYKNDVIKKLITHFKFYFKKDIGVELGKTLGNFVKNNKLLDEFNDGIVLPVPLHFFKKIKRGFNQSEILAEKFAKRLDLYYTNRVLIRRKHTRQQSSLTKQKRLSNLVNSFKIRKNQIDNVDNKIIFIIDDVVSTGTTLNEIAKILKQNGAKKVIGIILASN